MCRGALMCRGDFMCNDKRFALLAKIVEIDVAEVGTQNNEICSCGPDRRGSSPVGDNFFLFF